MGHRLGNLAGASEVIDPRFESSFLEAAREILGVPTAVGPTRLQAVEPLLCAAAAGPCLGAKPHSRPVVSGWECTMQVEPSSKGRQDLAGWLRGPAWPFASDTYPLLSKPARDRAVARTDVGIIGDRHDGFACEVRIVGTRLTDPIKHISAPVRAPLQFLGHQWVRTVGEKREGVRGGGKFCHP